MLKHDKLVSLSNPKFAPSDATGDTISNFENVLGSDYNDVLSGTNGANTLDGGAGNDTLNGRGGNDRIDGFTGNDIMTGGTGNDTFVFEGWTNNTGIDHIRDFDVNHDHIEIDSNGFSVHTSFSLANINLNSMTVDVIIHIGSNSEVILDHMSMADATHVPDLIDIV